MKIKAVRKNQNCTWQDYLTFGKEYEVLKDYGDTLIIKDDDGDPIFIRLTGSAHGFDFEVVQEEPEQKVHYNGSATMYQSVHRGGCVDED